MATDSLLSGVLGGFYGLNAVSNNLGLQGLLASLSLPASAPAVANTVVNLSDLGQLQSASDSFGSALQGLLSPGGATASQLSNANPSVLAATALPTAASGSYQIDVAGLALSQTLQSAVYATPDSTVIGAGSLTLQLGRYDTASNSFTADGAAPVSVSISTGTLNGVASAINAASAGVNALVVQGGGGYRLVVSSARTGAGQGFEVQADNDGLAALAYDPTHPGAGGLALTQGGEDASLSVNGASQTSASNQSVALAPGLTANLLQVGTTTLTVAPDNSGLLSQAKGLVSAFNNLQASLNTVQSGRGPGADVAQLYSESLQLAAFGNYNNGSSALTSLGQIGLNYQPSAGTGGATLALDTAGFSAALAADPSGTASLLNQAVQTLSTVASSYGDPGGVIGSTQGAYQSTLFIDQLLQGNAAPSSPLAQQLQADQVTAGPLNAAQIAGLQQYVTAVQPLQQDAFDATLLGDLYSGGVGGLLSVFA